MNKSQSQTLAVLLLGALFLLQITYFTPPPQKTIETPTQLPRTTWLDPAYTSSKPFITIQNEDLLLSFSQKGGHLAQATLKKHTDPQGNPLSLLAPETTQIRTTFTTPTGKTIDTASWEFKATTKKTPQGSQLLLTAHHPRDPSLWIKYIFLLPPKGYTLHYTLAQSKALENRAHLPILHWIQKLLDKEKHPEQSLSKTLLKYYDQEHSLKELKESKDQIHTTPAHPLHWLAVHTPYFLIGITAQDLLTKTSFALQTAPSEDPNTLKEVTIETALPAQVTFYFGPNEYYALKGVAKDFQKNYYLGPPVFRYVNRYFILPTSQYLKKYLPNYIWILILLILLLSLLQSFFSYQNYITNLRVKGAKPIIDQLNPTGGHDPQDTLSMMHIRTKIGANPFKTLVYAFIQIPIFVAMVNFTRHQIDFRKLPFLWISDISAYDDLISFPFHIPILGNHLTLIGLISSGLFFFISRLKTPPPTSGDNSSRLLSYIMPLIFLVMFNSTPSSWWIYHSCNNLMELLLYGLFKLTVNEKKIIDTALLQAKEAYASLQATQTLSRSLKRQQAKEKKTP